MLKIDYNKLSLEDKQLVNTLGVEEYNIQKQLKWQSDKVQLHCGDWMLRDEFLALSNEDATLIGKIGVEAFNKQKNADFKATTVKIAGGYILKEDYEKLSPEDQKRLYQVGYDRFVAEKQNEIDAYIKQQPKATQEWIRKYGLERFNIRLEEAERETNGAKRLGMYIGLGLIERGATFAGFDSKGEVQYIPYVPPVNLNNIDYNKLTKNDYARIVQALKDDGRIKILPGVVGASLLTQISVAYQKFAEEQTPENKAKLKAIQKQATEESLIDVAAFVFPPARALRADTTLKDISGVEWAIGAAQIALLVVSPSLGIIGKAGGAVGKAAAISSKALQAGTIATYGVITAVEWDKMTPLERTVNVALNVTIIGAVYGKTIVSGLKAVTSKLKGAYSKVPDLMMKMTKAVKAGDAQKIRTIAANLEKVGAKIKGTNGNIVRQQARYFNSHADEIALKGVTMPKKAFSIIKKVNSSISKMVKTGEAGEMTPIPKGAKDAAKEQVKRIKEADKIIREEALHPSITAKPLPEWMKKGIAEGYFEKAATPATAAEVIKAKPTMPIPAAEEIAKLKLAGAVDAWLKTKGNLASAVETWLKVKNSIIMDYALKKLAPIWVKNVKAIDLSKSVSKQMTSGLTAQETANLSAVRQAELLKKWQAMSYNAALREMLSMNMVTIAMSSSAKTAINIISNASPELRTEALQIMSPSLRTIVSPVITGKLSATAKIISNAQTTAKTEVDYATRVMTQIDTATAIQQVSASVTNVASEAITKGLTQTEVETRVKQAAIAEVKQLPSVAIQQVLNTKIDTITDIAIQEAVKIQLATVTPTITKYSHSTFKKTYPPPPAPFEEEKKKELTKEELAGAVQWKQGIMYIMIYPPYNKLNWSRKPYAGIRKVKGAKSAYKTLQKLGQKLPSRLAYDMGIMDVKIITSRGGKGDPKLRFAPDVKQKTTHKPKETRIG